MLNNNTIQENKSGFKVPSGYWDTLEDSTLTHLKSRLVEQKSGFSVPKNYFDDFELQTPSKENTHKTVTLNTWTRWLAAASIAALAVVGALYIDHISPSKNLQFSDLDKDIIEDYLDEHLETPEEFIDYENTSIKTIINQNIISLQHQDIINYLDDKLDEQDYDNDK